MKAKWQFYMAEVVWVYNVILAAVTNLGILFYMFEFDYTYGSLGLDMLILCMYPFNLVLMEWNEQYGILKQSMLSLVSAITKNTGTYVVSVFLFLDMRKSIRSEGSGIEVFCIGFLVLFSAFYLISTIYLSCLAYQMRPRIFKFLREIKENVRRTLYKFGTNDDI